MAIKVEPFQVIPLQPAAAPIDTFMQAPRPVHSNLWAVADALKGLEGTLDSLVNQRKGEADANAAAMGELAFYKNNQQGYNEAVKAGVIPAQNNPHFVDAYKKAEGTAAGLQLTNKFYAEYQAWEGKNGTDTAAFDKFFAGFLKDNINTQDPKVAAGLVPQIRKLAMAAEGQWQDDLNKNLHTGLKKNIAVVMDQAIDNGTAQGMGSDTGTTDYDQLAKDLFAIRETAAANLRPEEVDKELVDAITAKAIENGDPKMLAILDEPIPGSDHALSDEPYGRDQKQATLKTIASDARTKRSDDSVRLNEQNKRDLSKAWGSALDFMLDPENAGKPIPQDIINLGTKADPKFRLDIIDANAKIHQPAPENPQAEHQLYLDIASGGGRGAVVNAFKSGNITDPKTLREAYAFAKSMEDPKSSTSAIMKGPLFDAAMNGIKQAGQSRMGKYTQPWEGDTLDVVTAKSEYIAILAQMAAKLGPDATPDQIAKAQRDAFAMVTQRFNRPQGPMGDVTYEPIFSGGNSPAPAGQAGSPPPSPAPQAGGRTQGQGSQGQGPAGGAQSDPAAVQRRQSFWDNLSPTQQAQFKDAAKAAGMTREQAIDAATSGSSAPPPASPAPAPQAAPAGQPAPAPASPQPAPAAPQEPQPQGGVAQPQKQSEAPQAQPQAPAAGTAMDVAANFLQQAGVEPPRDGESATDYLTRLTASLNPVGTAQAAEPAIAANPPPASTAPITNLSTSKAVAGLKTAGKLKSVDGFIIHHTAGRGTVQGVINTFRQRGFPAQYVIDRKGKIYQILPDGVAGRQIRNSPDGKLTNRNTIGVEVIAKDDSDILPEQVAAAEELYKMLAAKYPTLTPDKVYGHGVVNPGHKQATEGMTISEAIKTRYLKNTQVASK